MISPSGRTGFEHQSTVELEEFIRENRKFTKASLTFGESRYEKAVRTIFYQKDKWSGPRTDYVTQHTQQSQWQNICIYQRIWRSYIYGLYTIFAQCLDE